MIRAIFRSLMQFLMLLLFTSICTSLYAQKVMIKIVNGRNGREMAPTCVSVWSQQNHKDMISIPTDKDGIARLRLTDNDDEIDVHNRWKGCGLFGVTNPIVKYKSTLHIYVGYALCLPPPDHSLLDITGISTRQLMQRGIVMPNTCGKATALPKPGELVIFVKRFGWWRRTVE
ncbi:MAG: hypothetical protein ACLQMO_15420 [Acidobacteriaceae bacterium]